MGTGRRGGGVETGGMGRRLGRRERLGWGGGWEEGRGS